MAPKNLGSRSKKAQNFWASPREETNNATTGFPKNGWAIFERLLFNLHGTNFIHPHPTPKPRTSS